MSRANRRIGWHSLFTRAELCARAKGLVSELRQVDTSGEKVGKSEIRHSKATSVSGGYGRGLVQATGTAGRARWLRRGRDISEKVR